MCFIATYMVFYIVALNGPIMILNPMGPDVTLSEVNFSMLYSCYFMFYVWGF